MTRDAQLAAPPARRFPAPRRSIGWAGALLLVLGASAQAAPRPIEVENVWLGLSSSNSYKVGTWTPVWVQLRGGDNRFEGLMEVVVADDDGTPTSYFARVDVGSKANQTVTAYVRPGANELDLSIRLYDRDRRRVAAIPQDALLHNLPVPLMPQETMILTMGQPQGVEALKELAGFQEGGKGPRQPGNAAAADFIVVSRLDPRIGRLPARWYGYDAARTIVLDTGQPDVIPALDALRGQPLVDWVKHGGHLVLSVGSNWQAVQDSVLGPILPGKLAGQVQLSSLEALDTFAGAGSTRSITPPGTPKVMVTKLEEVEQRGGTPLSMMSGLPLIVRGPCGFGRITLIAVDTNQKLFSEWPDRNLFWARAIDLHTQRADQASGGVVMGGPGRWNTWGISDIAGMLRSALEQFPGVRLIPFGWVAFFIFLYILLIGPGDYFFLKKVLKRMELTWITFPAIVVTVSLLAYYAAYLFKGNDLLVNQIDVVDVDQTTGLARGASWAGLFSPQNHDYTMRALPLPLDREPPAEASRWGGGSEPPRPTPGTEVILSWFSSPENQLGAMGNTNRRFSFGSGGYSYGGYGDRGGAEPSAGAIESLQGVRIPIWSTKCVMARWFGPAAPLVDSDLRPVGLDRLQGTITNRLDIPLEDALVAFGRHVYLVGQIGPRATIRVELIRNERDLSGYLAEIRKARVDPMRGNPEHKIDRYALMLGAMFHDSELQPGGERPLNNDSLYDLDLTGQLVAGQVVLPRPMLAARVARPGSVLILDDAPSAPKVERTTVVRAILPLTADPARKH
jgi:hypothetical protein